MSVVGIVLALLAVTGLAQDKGEPEGPSAEQLRKGRALILAALEKRGGKKALESVRDYTLKLEATQWVPIGGKFEPRPATATRRVLVGPIPCFEDRYRLQLSEHRQEDRRLVLVGNKGRVQHRLGAAALPTQDVADQWASHHRSELEVLRTAFVKDATIAFATSRPASPKSSTRETKDDVIVTRRGEAPIRVTIESKTGRFLRIEWKPLSRDRSGAPIPTWTVAFADFQDFGALKEVAREATVKRGDQLIAKRRTVQADINTGLKPADFPLK